MKVKDLRKALNGCNDDDEIVFELDYDDIHFSKLAISLGVEALCGDKRCPIFMDASKITNFIYDGCFHPVLSLVYCPDCESGTTLLDGENYKKVYKAIDNIELE